MGRFAPPPSLRARLETIYAEPHRHYHTLAHIEALRRHLARWHSLAIDARLIDAAIWFHDAIYDTRRVDNEARAAQLARDELAALGWPMADAERVAALVLATQHHDAPRDDADAWLFLDLDLSVLAQRADRYDAYRHAIRHEYDWVPEARYAQGRANVLERFAQRDAIYRTPALHAAWEQRARRNLAAELGSLTAGGDNAGARRTTLARKDSR
jgi:predicted metal-dependent HD superfamily phosphohydrolase